MKLYGLVICAAILSACVADVSAQESIGVVGGSSSSTSGPESAPDESTSVVISSRPVRYADADGGYEMVVEWFQDVDHPDFAFGVEASVRLSVSPRYSSEDLLTSYVVDGAILVDAPTATCTTEWAAQSCGLLQVTDAAFTGSAVVLDSALRLSLEWERFGPEQSPGLASMVIGRWTDGRSASSPMATMEVFDLSEALETSGLVGRVIEVGLSPHSAVSLTGTSTWGLGHGSLTLVPARDR